MTERDATTESSGPARVRAVLKYLELKTGFAGNGPAWIGRVKTSRTGSTLYFNGRALKKGSVGEGNYFDLVTGEAFWVSGVKLDGNDRHWCGSGKITIGAAVVEEYLAMRGMTTLDLARFIVSTEIIETNPASFVAIENRPL